MFKKIKSKLNNNKKNIYTLYPFNIIVILCIINIVLSDGSDSTTNTETLTSVIRYSLNDSSTNYATVTTTPLGNLICSASYYGGPTIKYYYGLKPNGRPYFKKNGMETEYCSTDSDKARNEGFISGIQLSDTSTDNKEYIFAIGNNDANIEVYDFSEETPVVYSKYGKTFFNSYYNSFKYGTITKLKNSSGNVYILSLIILHTDNVKYVDILKLSFSSPDIASNHPIIQTQSYQSSNIYFSSCFEDDNYIIICFYTTPSQVYTLAAFNYDLVYQNTYNHFVNTKYEDSIFYKGIHFYGNVGAFLYYNNEGNICINFLKFESNNFNNVLNQVIITNNGYYNHVQKNDLIKIADKKLCYITLTTNSRELHLFMVNNFVDQKILVRHYTIKAYEKSGFSFGQELRMTLYNDYISLATVGNFTVQNTYSYLIIFSYPNSTDFTLDVTDSLKAGKNPEVNFYEKCKIENNIFGYEVVGVQVLSSPNDIKLLIKEDKTEITSNTIFTQNIELILKDVIILSSNYRIEYTFVVQDAPYSSFKEYSEITNINLCYNSINVCEEEIYYQQANHVGRTSYCDISIDSTKISNNCDENCIFCSPNTQECYFCKDNFWKNEDDNKKCTNITKIITSIPIIPSTIAKIPSTSPKVIPSTIPNVKTTEFPSTIYLDEKSEAPTERINVASTEENQDNNCTVSEILNNKCKNGPIDINQLDEIKNSLLNEEYNGENTIIETETVIIQLSRLDDQVNQENENISNIDLGECEDKLREENHLDDDEDLIIYKIDIKTSDLSTTYVTYEVYDSSLNKLSLDVCSDIQITINVPVNLDDTLDSLAKSLSDSGYNLFNENDSFYNDICSTYTSENGTDMLLSDRKADIYSNTQNTTICQTDCELESYNSTTKKAKCNCEVATTSTISSLNIDNLFNKKEIAKSFYDTLANSNFLVMKCYKLAMDFSLIFKNYGEIIMTILTFIFLTMMLIYFILGNKKIHHYLITILKWNAKNGPNKNSKFDAESVAVSDDKKIVHENKKNKKEKRIKFKTGNEPPKKSKRKVVEFSSVVNNNYPKNSETPKFVTSTNDLKQNKSEGVNKNKRNKNRNKIIDEKIRHFTNKASVTKKEIKETEENNKKEILETGYNDIRKKNYTDKELDELDYELAIIYDKRTFFQYYWCMLKENQLLIFTFLPMDDFNLMYAKIALFIISFGLFITINGFFFSDDTMHKVYEDNGEFDIIYQIPQIFYSSVISSVANVLLKNLSLSEASILELKKETYFNIHKAKKKARQIERCLKIKLILFFIISLILMLFFWYFISCFCAVYRNTQVILLKDTGISFGASMLYPFALSFLPGIFRIPALRAKNQNQKCLYKLSKLINWLI